MGSEREHPSEERATEQRDKRFVVQAKLRVDRATSESEREADRVAELAVRALKGTMPSTSMSPGDTRIRRRAEPSPVMGPEGGALDADTDASIRRAPGEFQPSTADGRHMLARELAHTVQQGAAPTRIKRSPLRKNCSRR